MTEDRIAPPESVVRPLPSLVPGAMLLTFLLSGMAALMYQIIWAKQLALVFGVTIYATSAVVTAFMAGLALGSLLIGRVADRCSRPLVLFALLELGIGAFGLVFPALLDLARPLYVRAYGPFWADHYVMSLVRFGLCFAILIVPTALMGGTLPVISRAYVRHSRRLGREVAGLYSANNLGAVLGCMLAGFALVELLGVRGTLGVAVALNAVVAVVALALAGRVGAALPEDRTPNAEPETAEEGRMPGPVKAALWVFGIEGFASLAYQMAWTRLLIFFVTTGTYALTAIVATFLVGLSLGAFLVRPLVDRVRDLYRVLGIIELAIGLSALVTIPLLPYLMVHYTQFSEGLRREGWGGLILARFAISFAVILVPTTFMGATMPVVSRIYLPALKRVGRKMGIIGCLDTVGSIFGAFAGGFVLIPLLGIQRTIIATALINIGLAVWVFAVRPVAQGRRVLKPAFILSVAALLLAPWLLLKPRMMLIHAAGVTQQIAQGRILQYTEDAESSVTVIEEYGTVRSLFVNDAGVAKTSRFDLPSHEMIGHVPVLLHPDPRRALLVGFGIGFTSWAVTAHGVEVDVVELSPGVLQAGQWFTEFNNDIARSPLVRIIIDDGHNYVLGTQRKYDVVQAGIIHPGLNAGNAGFYTVDFYEDCKRILTRDGVICQWLPLHSMRHEDFRMLVRSFQAAFPHTSIWFKHTSDFCTLVGSPRPLRIDFADIERRVNKPEVRAHLRRSNVVDVCDLLDSYCISGDALRQAVGPGEIQTDDRPLIEFRCSRIFPARVQADTVQWLADIRRPVRTLLTGVPAGREPEVNEALDRWYAGTGELLRAEKEAVEMQCLSPRSPDFDPTFQRMLTGFVRARRANPQDENANYLTDYYIGFYAVTVAADSMRRGDYDEARRILEQAMADLGTDSYYGLAARSLYRRLPKASGP